MIRADEKIMRLAIEEAELARKKGDYAVGAVLVKGKNIIAVASNRSKRDKNPVAHAETLAIMEGSRKLKSRHLKNCILYCTHEPCPMCASVIVWTRLRGVIYGARYQDMKKYRDNSSNRKWLWRTIDIPCKEIFSKSTEKIEVVSDFLRKECVCLFHNS